MQIHESGENYLEAILALSEKGPVRSIDVAQHLGFSKPSVSRAMSILKSAGMIIMDKNNQILLTEAGRKKAEAVYERHCLLSHFLEQILGVSAEIASADACRIEHVISAETFERIKDFIKQQEKHAVGGQQ